MVTSSEISNLISQQLASASQLQAFTQGISPGQQQSQAQASFGSQVGMAAASAVASAAHAAPFMAAGASMLGMAPTIFDPFSGTLAATKAGFGLSSALGSGGIGRAAATGVGFGMAALGGYMAAGAMLNTATEQLMRGAQEQLQVNEMMSRAATRHNLPLMGGMPANMGGQMGGFLRGMSSNMGVPLGDVTGFVQQGLEGGMFRSARSMGQFQSQVSGLSDSLQMLSSYTGMPLQSGMGAIQQMQGLGFHGHRQAANAYMAYQGMAGGLGMDPQALTTSAMYGGYVASNMGMSRSLGTRVATGLASRIGTAALTGSLSTEDILDMGGGSSLNEALPMLSGQLTQSALSLAANNTSVMAALMDPETGQLDPGQVAMFRSGSLSSKDLKRTARKNMRNKGVRTAISARSGSLASDLVDQLGPEGVLGGFAQSEMLSRGIKPGENSEDVMDMLLQQYTGLGEQQANIVQTLINEGPAIRSEASRILKEQLARTKQGADFNKNYSIEAIKKKMIDATVGPTLQKFRDFGAGIVNWGSELVESGVNYLFGEDKRFQQPIPTSQYGQQKLDHAIATGTNLDMSGGVSSGGGYSFSTDLVSGPKGALMSWAPGFQNGYSPAMSAAGPAAWAAGRGMGAAGGAAYNMIGRAVTGGAGGMMASARSLLGGVGLGALGVAGKLLGPIGMVATGYDFLANQVPAMGTGMGLRLDESGALDSGVSAALVRQWREGELQGSGLDLENIERTSNQYMGMIGGALDPSPAYNYLGREEHGLYKKMMGGRGYGKARRGASMLSGFDGNFQADTENLGEYLSSIQRAAAAPHAALRASGLSDEQIRNTTREIDANQEAFWAGESSGNLLGMGYTHDQNGMRSRIDKAFPSLVGVSSLQMTAYSSINQGLPMGTNAAYLDAAFGYTAPSAAESLEKAAKQALRTGSQTITEAPVNKRNDYPRRMRGDSLSSPRVVTPYEWNNGTPDVSDSYTGDDGAKALDEDYKTLADAFGDTGESNTIGKLMRDVQAKKEGAGDALHKYITQGGAGTRSAKGLLIGMEKGSIPGFLDLVAKKDLATAFQNRAVHWTAERDALRYDDPLFRADLASLVGGSADKMVSGMKDYYNELLGGSHGDKDYGDVGDFAGANDEIREMLSGFTKHTPEERAAAVNRIQGSNPLGAHYFGATGKFYDAGSGKEKKRGEGVLRTLSMLPESETIITGKFTKDFYKQLKKGGRDLVDEQYSDIEKLIKRAIPDIPGEEDDKARGTLLGDFKTRIRAGKNEIAATQDTLSKNLAVASTMFRKGGAAGGGANTDALGDFSSKLKDLLPALDALISKIKE